MSQRGCTVTRRLHFFLLRRPQLVLQSWYLGDGGLGAAKSREETAKEARDMVSRLVFNTWSMAARPQNEQEGACSTTGGTGGTRGVMGTALESRESAEDRQYITCIHLALTHVTVATHQSLATGRHCSHSPIPGHRASLSLLLRAAGCGGRGGEGVVAAEAEAAGLARALLCRQEASWNPGSPLCRQGAPGARGAGEGRDCSRHSSH